MGELRAPPHSIDAEKAVLGGILLTETGFDDVAGRVSADDFYREDHRLVFEAIAALRQGGHPADVVTVAESLQAQGQLERFDGGAYLQTLARNVFSAANIVAYADIVREKAVLRALIQASSEIMGNAFDAAGRTSAELLQMAEVSIAEIAETGRRGSGTLTGAEAKAALWDDLDRRTREQTTGLETGLFDLDAKLGGIEPADFVIIAGRPSMGKTALMLNIADHQDCPVGIFSMETTATKLLRRLVASKRIDYGKLKCPWKLTESEWQRASEASRDVSDDLHITDVGAMSIGALELEARHLVRKKGVRLICIDYLQQITCQAERRFEEVSEVSRRLQALAKGLKVPIIALSQLRRMDQDTANPKPKLSDLRESGQLEQDADIVILIHRPEYYTAGKRPAEADLIVDKAKDGETGTVIVTWQGRYQRFVNFAPRQVDPSPAGGERQFAEGGA